MKQVAQIYIDSFTEDLEKLNILPPTNYTPASEYVREQIVLVKTLIEKGYAYEISDGVYFDIARFPEYGALGNVDLDSLKAGARVEANTEKRHPADFALWKKGELGWESDWGRGFPGWHTECTAMIFSTLGKQIDIHTGGEDLQHTHHNGEIAQAECITGKPYVGYWLHNALITLKGEKLAKSTGNMLHLNDLIEKGYSPLDYRYLLMTSHYRSPMNFTWEALDGARTALERLKKHVYADYVGHVGEINSRYQTAFAHLVNDDLNIPKAIALLWELVKDPEVTPGEKLATIRNFDQVLGLGLSDETNTDYTSITIDDLPTEIQALITEREAARAVQNWPEADRLRDALSLEGYSVEDTSDGPSVTKA